jgi:patatin-like phospholipase/acyl hydrolase
MFLINRNRPPTTMRVLSIDGGGVRVAAAVSFLAELEAQLPHGETLLTQFDAFAGTSAGSMVISAIVYGGMTATQIRDQMFSVENVHKIMPPSMRDTLFGIVQLKPEYDGKGKREVIDEHIPEDVQVRDTDKKVIIAWTDIDYEEPRLSLSWEATGNVAVRDVVDASSAAPGYFPFVEFESREEEKTKTCRGIDGAVFANDPSDLACLKLIESFGNAETLKVLSVGTGTVHGHWDGNKVRKDAGGIPWMITGNLMSLFFDTPRETVKYRMSAMSDTFGFKYCRVTGFVQNDSMDNTRPENIRSLKASGKEWWDEKGETVMDELFSNSIN